MTIRLVRAEITRVPTIGMGIKAFFAMSFGVWETTELDYATVLISGPRRIGSVVDLGEDAKAITWRSGIRCSESARR